jgi:Zn ribbon nucleic-acid-binding protein
MFKKKDNIRGKFRKNLNKKCPDCENGSLQLREIEGVSIVICEKCGYEEEDKTKIKNNIRKSREVKNEELEIYSKQTSPSSNFTKRHETNNGKGRR